jgi:hypothetical protein
MLVVTVVMINILELIMEIVPNYPTFTALNLICTSARDALRSVLHLDID